ncbi:IS630 family transposase, partial [Streptococcus criceti]
KNKAFKTLEEVINQLQEVIQSFHWKELKTIVHRKWTSAMLDFL